MVAENVTDDFSGGRPRYYSAGEYVAVICEDYPQLWDVTLPPGPERRQQYRDAVADVQGNRPTGASTRSGPTTGSRVVGPSPAPASAGPRPQIRDRRRNQVPPTPRRPLSCCQATSTR